MDQPSDGSPPLFVVAVGFLLLGRFGDNLSPEETSKFVVGLVRDVAVGNVDVFAPVPIQVNEVA